MANGRITVKDVYELIEDFRKETKESYVSKSEFWPVRTLVYTFTSY